MSIADPRDEEERFLRGLGLSKLFIAQMRLRAERNGTTIETELLASGNVQEAVYYASLAKVLGLYFVEDIDPTFVADSDVLDSQLRRPSILRLTPPHGSSLSVIVPQAGHVAEWRRRLEQSAELRDRVAVTTPSALRRAVWQAGAPRRAAGAADALFDASPELSARSVLTGGQGFLAGFLLAFYAGMFAVFPQGTMHASHIGLTSSFFVLILLRGFAVRWGAVRASKVELAVDFRLPVYTVLVAVYQEKEVAEQLVAALLRLDWPHSRLDIKLICEARDPETIQAFSSINLPPHFEIVAVPDLAPRTKPKALNYGLAGARGEYVVIYDAEDRPHRHQLREAYARFQASPPEVACLQAPLIIANGDQSWMSALFALEYAGLFRRLLPYLASRRQPLPLGGTSNHFRVDVLKRVGAWDPYNVTEDADLGMRLYRLGYRAETLIHHTVEDAPTEQSVWIGQRTRWYKGWMQTWLVLMRHPVLLAKELGWRGTITFHVLVTGMLISALGHPLILLFIGMTLWHLTFAPHTTPWEIGLFVVDWFNVVFAYTVFFRLGWNAMGQNERRRVGVIWRYVPFYWMLMSLAGWKAAIELRRKPYFWNKTPHKPSAQRPISVE